MKKHSDLKNEMIALKFGGDYKRIEQIVPDKDFNIDKILEFQQGLRVLVYQFGKPVLIRTEINRLPTYTESEIMTEAEQAQQVERFREKIKCSGYMIFGFIIASVFWLVLWLVAYLNQ